MKIKNVSFNWMNFINPSDKDSRAVFEKYHDLG